MERWTHTDLHCREILRGDIIPSAYLWFTGEAVGEEDDEEEDVDDEDDEDHDEASACCALAQHSWTCRAALLESHAIHVVSLTWPLHLLMRLSMLFVLLSQFVFTAADCDQDS